jgi:pSer/pThr/pTyr-binding forkhead associated (FHA) protein
VPHLIVTRDGRVENRVELGEVALTIGRDPSNQIRLDDPSKWVSRFHAEVRPGPAGYTLVDLDTPNGMLVAGTGVRQVVLEPGVNVTLGPYSLEYDAEPTSETNPGGPSTVFDPNAGRLAGRAPQGDDPRPARAHSTIPPPMQLPSPQWTKTQKQLLVFGVTILVVVAVAVVSLVALPPPMR